MSDNYKVARKVGERVVLMGVAPGILGCGSLNSIFLAEEGGDTPHGVPIARVTSAGHYVVTLPKNQYELTIMESDIDRNATAALTPGVV